MPLGQSRWTFRAREPGREPVAPELPPAERRRRRREAVIAVAVFAAIAAVVVFEERISKLGTSLPIGDGVLFLFLNAVNVILIGLLVFLIARNFVKLVFERRRGILGSHLNARFVLAFLFIATVPTAVLFAVSAFFITSSINTYFSLQVDDALEQSRAVADAYYEESSRDALFYGRRIAEQIRGDVLAGEPDRARLAELVQAKQREYNLGVVEVFSASGEELVAASNPEIPSANFSRPESDLVRSALAGSSVSSISELGGADVIRGAVPVLSAAGGEAIVGAVVVNTFVPRSLSRRVADIRAALDEYRRLQPNAGHIRTVYLLELLLIFLVVLLLATWWGLRMAKGVTGPIRALVEGTDEVARGNLDVVVESTSEDEVGFLVRSFNQMTHDLREARTGLERSNTELDQRRSYMEIVLRNIGAGVVSIDAEGRINTINPSAQRLLGVPPGSGLAGRKIEDVLTHPEHIEIVRELAAQLRPGMRESIRRQVQIPSGDEVLTLLVSLTLLQDEDGRRLGMVLVFDDYTQLVKVQRMAAWREVARRIAHEIKNPLTPIQLSAQRIRRRFRERLVDGVDDAKVFDECVDTITTQVESLKLLVNEFSNFARLPTASPKPDDLNRLVADTVASYAETEGVRLRTELDAALPSVDLDREQVRRAISNLIENAIAAIREQRLPDGSPGEGTIELRTVHDGLLGTARLEVADEGPGIRPEDRRRIFEPYFSTRRGGTGLGLAIVSRIIADHHGYIRVHDNRPRGTRFIVELPVRGV
jgi:two-component system nitrogen regulation sensor histidine kinase NtrY